MSLRTHFTLSVPIELLLTLAIGVFMGALDMTILAPALPHIGRSFGLTPQAIVLGFSVYASFYALSVPLMSKLADLKGYRLVYGLSLWLFGISSIVAATAPSLLVLIGALMLQGIGGGGLFPVAQALVGVAVPKRERGTVLSLLLGAYAVGAVLGPNIGGLLVQNLSWRWIYWINVPLCMLGFLTLLKARIPDVKRKVSIDWGGAILVAVMFGTFVTAVEGWRHPDPSTWGSVRAGVLLTVTLVSLAILIPYEHRRSEPILDFRLIASRGVAPLLAISFLIGYALLGGIVFLPLYVQLHFSASSLGSGAVLNAAAVGMILSSVGSGYFTSRTGGRPLIIVGLTALAAAFAGLLVGAGSIMGILSSLVLLGMGLGLTQGPLSYISLANVSEKDQGQVSGLVAITRSLGGALGITMAGVLLGRAGGYESGIPLGWSVALGAVAVGIVVAFAIKNPEPDVHSAAEQGT